MKKILVLTIFSLALWLSPVAFSMDKVFSANKKAAIIPSAAELVPVPDNMQRLWVMQDCKESIVGYRFSKHFRMLSLNTGNSSIERIGGLVDLGNDRYKMVTPTETVGYIVGTKGDLIQYYGDPHASFSLSDLEDHKIMVPHILLKNCDSSSTSVIEDQTKLALLPLMDKVHEACPARNDIYKADCQKAVFGMFDSNADNALDQGEMEAAWRLIIPNSSFTACGVAGSDVKRLSADGLVYFAWLFSHLDKNADRRISFDEIYRQWMIMQGDPLMSEATSILIAAQGPLDLLPENVKLTCANCCLAIKE